MKGAKVLIALGCWWLCTAGLLAQEEVYISLFYPNNTSAGVDANHRVELFNGSTSNAFDLSGWYLVTRQYAVRFPAGVKIGSLRSVSLAKSGADVLIQAGSQVVFRDAGQGEGDFVALFSPSLQLVDGFWFSTQSSVSFLPSRVPLPKSVDGPAFRELPPEADPVWQSMAAAPDPALSFVRISGQWRIQSRRANINPATEFDQFQGVYQNGRVNLGWTTTFEADCYFMNVERSTDNREFSLLSRVAGQVNQLKPTAYQYADSTAVQGRVYYYRIRNIDKFNNEIVSSSVRVRTEAESGALNLAIQRSNPSAGRLFDLRFSSQIAQQVRINLLDEELREIAVLFDGQVEAEKQHLIRLKKSLPVGKYFIVVSTESQKYYEQVVLE
jgi:hypothetical protein